MIYFSGDVRRSWGVVSKLVNELLSLFEFNDILGDKVKNNY